MLFDLRSRQRRTAVKVIYVFLALVMVGGLLLVGVGSGNSGGGLLNGLTNNGNTGASAVNYGPIDKALKQTRQNPKSASAWSALIQARWTAANQGANYNSAAAAYTKSGIKQLTLLAQAWQSYLPLVKQPSTTAAILAARAYEHIGNFTGAADAWEYVATAEQAASSYFCLAANAYAAKQARKAGLAAAQAISLTPKLQRATVKQQLKAAQSSSQYAQAC